MKNQVLSINQMQELINLGIDTSKASMCWSKFKYDSNFTIQAMSKNMFEEEIRNLDLIYTPYDYIIIPTFTLQDILEILPKIKHYYYPNLRQVNNISWQIIYKSKLGELEWIAKYGKTSIEAAFNMLKWCKQNNYI